MPLRVAEPECGYVLYDLPAFMMEAGWLYIPEEWRLVAGR